MPPLPTYGSPSGFQNGKLIASITVLQAVVSGGPELTLNQVCNRLIGVTPQEVRRPQSAKSILPVNKKGMP
jgi:septum formation inhibitor-activating ATPase MinD